MAPDTINFSKSSGLVPAIIQHYSKGTVLMLGYMNEEALEVTQEKKKITFYSRSKERLWTKGETSGHYLHLVDWQVDCDNDTLLFLANPEGPTCHTNAESCFHQKDFDLFDSTNMGFLDQLQKVLQSRKKDMPEDSYTTSLYKSGIDKIAQKVGEEAVETVIASKNSDVDEIIYESSDLLYHLMVLLTERGLSINDLIKELESRHG